MINHAATFRKLHTNNEPLLLANIWDAGSARLLESLGAKAVATTSAGVSWALGYPDGDALPLHLLASLVSNITRIIRIPLTVDLEGGYSHKPHEVGENVKLIVDAGAVGINIEDGRSTPELLVEKIEQIRNTTVQMGVDLFINARTDIYLLGLVSEEKRAEETIRRAAMYRDAGADGVFVPSLFEPKTISEIVQAVKLPVNVMVWPGLSSATELGKLGVCRVSAGSGIAQVLWKHAAELASSFLKHGASEPLLENCMAYPELQELFIKR